MSGAIGMTNQMVMSDFFLTSNEWNTKIISRVFCQNYEWELWKMLRQI